MARFLFTGILTTLMAIMGNATVQAELIVLASVPSHLDDYYQPVENEIFDFHIRFARAIQQNGDDVLILTNEEYYQDYVDKLGQESVLLAPMPDIWMRDFTVQNSQAPVQFRYSAAGQGGSQTEADYVQAAFSRLLVKAGIKLPATDLINDGGNFVDDGFGSVVISRKFLRDNRLSEAQARAKITELTQAKNIAFIEAEEQGGLEHADGVVSFVARNTLIINSYPQDPDYEHDLMTDLRSSLPNVKIVPITTPYDGSQIYDERFGSACGLYTNALVTTQNIYLPHFGIAEDAIALEQVQAITTRKVIPVDSSDICTMGGGQRCMSLQLRGAAAQQLRAYAQTQSR